MSQNDQTDFKTPVAFAAIFLNCVCPFWEIMNSKINTLIPRPNITKTVSLKSFFTPLCKAVQKTFGSRSPTSKITSCLGSKDRRFYSVFHEISILVRHSSHYWCYYQYSEPSQISKIKVFVRMINGLKPLTISAKSSILDV